MLNTESAALEEVDEHGSSVGLRPVVNRAISNHKKKIGCGITTDWSTFGKHSVVVSNRLSRPVTEMKGM